MVNGHADRNIRDSLMVNSALKETIRARLDQLTVKQARLGRYFLENPVSIALMSTKEVGVAAGVDPATVVRFCQLLGYSGFSDLRRSARAGLPQFLSGIEKLRRNAAVEVDRSDELSAVFSCDIANLQWTAARNDGDTLDRAVRILGDASSVYVHGMGMSRPVASTLALLLNKTGLNAYELSKGSIDTVVSVASLQRGDVLVVVCLWRYVRESIALVRFARGAGAKTMCISDSELSPLRPESDVFLVARSESQRLAHSITSFVALGNALATGVIGQDPKRALRRLQAIDHLYEVEGTLMRPDASRAARRA